MWTANLVCSGGGTQWLQKVGELGAQVWLKEGEASSDLGIEQVKEMMITIVTMLLLLTINAASLHTHQLQATYELANDYQLDDPVLPRKLMAKNKDDGHDAKDLVSFNMQHKAFAVKPHNGEAEAAKVMVHIAARGTRQEWIEGSDSTHEYFTMDYSHVKRRSPIHNKSFPKTVSNSP
ncbi:hypothetical protein M8C21_014872 [Ambrosia artemisiifolia]|uniref:Uncharacterized protein n=1 Tax=Ambrosia artemisiifolia TaxID=4212 RepID=A0AAD5D556_AMBAR|nr:hypothetical protein M8C21_014872 [Ambrosia artemisiifolia]